MNPPDNARNGIGFILLIAVVAVAALLGGIWMSASFDGRGQPPELGGGTLLEEPKPVPAFQLIDHRGNRFTREQLQGKWTFAFFGYTHCPDVCPTTLTTLNAVAAELREQGPSLDDVQFVFVSVDPERDTPEVLAEYVPYFNDDFIGVTGQDDALRRLTRQLGIVYKRTDQTQPGAGYLVDHSAQILLFDKQARLATVFSHYPHQPEVIAADFRAIRSYFGD